MRETRRFLYCYVDNARTQFADGGVNQTIGYDEHRLAVVEKDDFHPGTVKVARRDWVNNLHVIKSLYNVTVKHGIYLALSLISILSRRQFQ